MSYPFDDDYEGVEDAYEEWLAAQPAEDLSDIVLHKLVECPRGHEFDVNTNDVCPKCLDDADKWMDAERDA